MENILFSNIKEYLIASIDNTYSQIKIAVAWFTNIELFEAVLRALKRGVYIELIIIDDCINRNEFGLDFSLFIENGGHLYFSNRQKIMHNKFCIIDDKIVITGSYNWTYYAENKNWENIIAILNANIASKYNANFDMIKKQLEEVKEYNQYKLNEIEPKVLLNDYNYLLEDLSLKEKKIGSNYSFYLTSIIEKITIKKESTIQTSITQSSLQPTPLDVTIKTKSSLGLKCRVNGNDNCTAFIIKKGTEIPCEKSEEFCTCHDFQTGLECVTLLGDNLSAIENRLLGKIVLNDIPPLPQKQGKMIVTFNISKDKTLHVIARNIHTGTFVEAYYYLNEII